MNEKTKDQCELTACKPTNDLFKQVFDKIDAKVSVRIFLTATIIFAAVAGFMVVTTISISTSAAVIVESVKSQGKSIDKLEIFLQGHVAEDKEKHDKVGEIVRDLEKAIYGVQ